MVKSIFYNILLGIRCLANPNLRQLFAFFTLTMTYTPNHFSKKPQELPLHLSPSTLMTIRNRSVFGTLGFLFTIGFLLLIPKISEGQSVFEEVGRLPTTTYSTEEYGGYPQVFAAIQSEAGLMYFGTADGMYEYDGVSWRSLFNIRDFIPVRSLAKDSKERIFYGGADFGYLEVDEKGEARAVSLFHLIPEELKSGLIIVEILFLNDFILLRSPNYLIRLELGEDFGLKSLKSWQSETRFGKSFLVGNQIYVRYVDRGLFLLEGEELRLIPGTENFFFLEKRL